MTRKDIAETASKAGKWLADTTADAFEEAQQRHDDDLYNEGYEDGQNSQEKRDIRAAVRAFFDIKVKDQDVYRLLSEYFNVDSIKEATEYLMDAKKTSQIIALREYCKSQGMNYREFREYADSHNLDEALLLNKRLLDVPPEKLKLILDKNEGRR